MFLCLSNAIYDYINCVCDVMTAIPVNVSVVPINSSVDHMTDNVTFTCRSDAHDLNISYTWMFNDMYINDSNSDSFTVNGPWLTVYNVTYSLGGVYECVVTNLPESGRSRSYLFGM